MNSVKRILTWMYLLNKRFLKKPLFPTILLLVPIIVLCVLRLSSEESSLIAVGVASANSEDQTAARVIEYLVAESSSAVSYYACASSEKLRSDVSSGKARIGFLLSDDLNSLFYAYASQSNSGSSVLSVLENLLSDSSSPMNEHAIICYIGTDDIVAKMIREHFYGKIFRDLNSSVLKVWLKDHREEVSLTDEEIDEFVDASLESYSIGNDYISLEYLSGETIENEVLDRYLLSPMRGLLASLLVLTSLGSCLMLIEDEKKQLFIWVNPHISPLLHYVFIAIPILDIGIAVYVAIFFSGTFTFWQKEVAYLALFILQCAGFANLLRVIFRRANHIASLLPVILTSCLFLTPVFADIDLAVPFQILLPPYLYLNSIHGRYPAWTMSFYVAITTLASMLIDRFTSLHFPRSFTFSKT